MYGLAPKDWYPNHNPTRNPNQDPTRNPYQEAKPVIPSLPRDLRPTAMLEIPRQAQNDNRFFFGPCLVSLNAIHFTNIQYRSV